MAKNPAQRPIAPFTANLVALMAEAGRLGYYETQHKLHEVVRVHGWELAKQEKRKAQKHDN